MSDAIWCAMCGKMTDHGSGSCPELAEGCPSGQAAGSAPSFGVAGVLRAALDNMTQAEKNETTRMAKEIVERAHRAAKEQIADLEAHRGRGEDHPETLTARQLRDAIIDAVNDGDSADAIHYALRWRRVQNKADSTTHTPSD